MRRFLFLGDENLQKKLFRLDLTPINHDDTLKTRNYVLAKQQKFLLPNQVKSILFCSSKTY
jgi:hypothetical protein